MIVTHRHLYQRGMGGGRKIAAFNGSPHDKIGTHGLYALPDNLQDSTLADALHTIYDLNLSDIETTEPPCGLGRDQ
jgi:hypothetical protein